MTKKSKSRSIEEIATCAYIAGLFDGEGSIYFAKRPEKKKKQQIQHDKILRDKENFEYLEELKRKL